MNTLNSKEYTSHAPQGCITYDLVCTGTAQSWWRKPAIVLANMPTHTKSAFGYAQGHHKSTSL